MFAIITVNGASMSPTLKSNERVLAVTPPNICLFRRNQIITLQHLNMHFPERFAYLYKDKAWQKQMKNSMSEIFIKRIIGLPSDIIRIPLNDISEHLHEQLDAKATYSNGQGIWRIPEGYVFVRGDGKQSADSTVWGPVPISALRQIVLCRYPSLRRIR